MLCLPELVTNPYPWFSADGLFPQSLVNAAAAEWPESRWPWWIKYNDAHSVKRASRGRDGIPISCLKLLDKMAEIDVGGLLGDHEAFPDFTLHGAGLHEIPPGGWLSTHLDSSHHPVTDWVRVASMVLFVNSAWDSSWGGALNIGDFPVYPKSGRAVMMATSDQSFHSVSKVTGPESRKTLALFWWSTKERIGERRDKALFV